MRKPHFTTGSFGLLAVLVAVLAVPAKSKGQSQCLLCVQAQLNMEEDPNGPPDWQWLHMFDPETGPACDMDPHEMCRVCGGDGGSPCDGEDPIMPGKCPTEPCAPRFVLLEIGASITRLVSRLDDQTAPIMARTIALEPRLIYDDDLHAVKLTQCDATVVGTWFLDGSVRSHWLSQAEAD